MNSGTYIINRWCLSIGQKCYWKQNGLCLTPQLASAQHSWRFRRWSFLDKTSLSCAHGELQVGDAAAAPDGYGADFGNIDQNRPLCYSYSEGLKLEERAEG